MQFIIIATLLLSISTVFAQNKVYPNHQSSIIMADRITLIRTCILLLGLIFHIESMNAQRFNYEYKGVTFKCKAKAGVVTITSFDFKADDVTIPAVVATGNASYPVKEVSTFINGNNYSARRLVLEEGIERIANSSFIEFRKLQEVVLPSTLKMIGKNAFRNN